MNLLHRSESEECPNEILTVSVDLSGPLKGQSHIADQSYVYFIYMITQCRPSGLSHIACVFKLFLPSAIQILDYIFKKIAVRMMDSILNLKAGNICLRTNEITSLKD